EIDDDFRRVRGRDTLQDLDRRRPWAACRIAAKAVHGRSGGVTQQLAERDPRLPAAVRRHLPRREIAVHVGIEIESPALDQPHDSERKYRLADRGGLERRGGRHGIRGSDRAYAKAARPRDLAVVDD